MLIWGASTARQSGANICCCIRRAHVQYLDVSWNSFNEAASRALVCALATNTCLLELNMSYNRIGAAAAVRGETRRAPVSIGRV